MRRYGATHSEVDHVVAAADAAGLDVVGVALHLPLAGTDGDRLAEVDAWVAGWIPDARSGSATSRPRRSPHCSARHPDRRFRLRVGTRLWHGDKSFLHLDADVLGVRRDRRGERGRLPADDRRRRRAARDDRRRHGARRRAARRRAQPVPLRPTPARTGRATPHAHVDGASSRPVRPCPGVGDRVDVQRPLTLDDWSTKCEWV